MIWWTDRAAHPILWTMRRLFAFVILTAAVACSSTLAEPCDLLVKGAMAGRLIKLDERGCVARVDTIYWHADVHADTFRVCGMDTTKVSRETWKFKNDLPTC